MVSRFLMRENTFPDFNMESMQNHYRGIGKHRFLGFDVGLQFEKNDWQFRLMVRDITTTYNVWNIDEKE
jgi:hypothetical protein